VALQVDMQTWAPGRRDSNEQSTEDDRTKENGRLSAFQAGLAEEIAKATEQRTIMGLHDSEETPKPTDTGSGSTISIAGSPLVESDSPVPSSRRSSSVDNIEDTSQRDAEAEGQNRERSDSAHLSSCPPTVMCTFANVDQELANPDMQAAVARELARRQRSANGKSGATTKRKLMMVLDFAGQRMYYMMRKSCATVICRVAISPILTLCCFMQITS
jgi:hypothetical protein